MTDLKNNPIPKIIHYCWFGPNSMEGIHRRCIKSWKKNFSEFKFMKWDESNTEISQHPFLEAAFKMERWAFVSDYIRLHKLFEFGGIYLDTDMLPLKPLNKCFLRETFFGAENPKFISCGIIGARKGDNFIARCLENYNDIDIKESNLLEFTIPQVVTSTFRSTFDYNGDFLEIVKVQGVNIFPSSYFYSLPYKERNSRNKKKYVVEQSYAIHLWDESWKDLRISKYLRKGNYQKGFKLFFQKIGDENPYDYFKRILTAFIK